MTGGGPPGDGLFVRLVCVVSAAAAFGSMIVMLARKRVAFAFWMWAAGMVLIGLLLHSAKESDVEVSQ